MTRLGFIQDSNLAHRKEGFVEISCCGPALFRGWPGGNYGKTADLLEHAVARVEAGGMTRTKLKELEVAFGLNANVDGLLACRQLRQQMKPEVVTYDWVHNMLQGGVLTSEVEGLLGSAVTEGLADRAALQTFLEDAAWNFPKFAVQKGRHLHRVFDERRVFSEDPDRVKASCSELLGCRMGSMPQSHHNIFFNLLVSLHGCESQPRNWCVRSTVAHVMLSACRMTLLLCTHWKLW